MYFMNKIATLLLFAFLTTAFTITDSYAQAERHFCGFDQLVQDLAVKHEAYGDAFRHSFDEAQELGAAQTSAERNVVLTIPVVFHVGGTGDLIDAAYFTNGRPIPPDFHGGDENFRSVDYMGIPGPPMQTLATLIFDGVLERFPRLRIGVIEQGAIWLPSWLRQMESAVEAFGRHEERLRALSLRPSEYVARQVRVTPYPTEDVGWIIEQSSPDVCLFSSDYPHVEGGRRPFERFERSLGDASEDIRHKFYAANFEDLMGRGLPAALAAA